MKYIEFLKDFATKKKGDIDKYDGTICINLINRGIAKYINAETKAKSKVTVKKTSTKKTVGKSTKKDKK